MPVQWVEESTREQAYIGPDNYVGGLDRRFGYMWSIFPNLKYYGYLGTAEQELFVLPEQNMLIVFTGALPVGKEAALLRLVNDYIIPADLSEVPLPDSPQAFAKLQALVQAAADSPQPVPALRQIPLEISGKTYKLDPNPLGWKDTTFIFQTDTDAAILNMSGSPDLLIGLDERYRLTESPGSRSVDLRGRWLATSEIELDDIIQGEYIESVGRFKFERSQMTLSITSLTFGEPPMKLHVSIAEHKP